MFPQELEKAGFVNVRAEDRSEQFIDVLKRELVKFGKMKEEFISVSKSRNLIKWVQ